MITVTVIALVVSNSDNNSDYLDFLMAFLKKKEVVVCKCLYIYACLIISIQRSPHLCVLHFQFIEAMLAVTCYWTAQQQDIFIGKSYNKSL